MANTYLEGSLKSVYQEFTLDEEGLKKFMRNFSFPGGSSSHVSPEVPGSINEGGELGYSLAHAFGAVLDNPNLIVTTIVGDGEAETGPLATSWHLNKFLNPVCDGAVLPVLHLNGYKIANPTILARISTEELLSLFKGYGWVPYIVEYQGDELALHEQMASVMDEVIKRIQKIWQMAREKKVTERPLWPMIILKTPKGFTGPKEIDGKKIADSFRSHQIPIEVTKEHPESLTNLEDWLKSYHPEELFDVAGHLKKEYQLFLPELDQTMGKNVHANGGLLRKDLKIPDVLKYGVSVPYPGTAWQEDMRVLGTFIRDIVVKNPTNFRIFGPDEALSNRLNAVFEVTNRQWDNKTIASDEYLAYEGRVIDSFLSEHVCEGLLEGYLLTGRHGFFHSYESFMRIVDSMISQHAKWLKISKEIPWREPISSLNLLVSSHCWQQDHNGFTHQDPGIINHVITKKADTARVYLPCDANTLLWTMNHVLRTKDTINVVVASKHPRLQWLSMNQAVRHCENGVGIWGFASNDLDNNPDIVLACAGDTPTLEIMAATSILRKFLPNLKVRVVNVIDLMRLVSKSAHPHGLTDAEYDAIFTKNKPIIFAFHGYPNVIHELTYKRHNQNMHVRGYIEEGTITTPFDMRVQNRLDRFHLVLLALDYLKEFDVKEAQKYCVDMLKKHQKYIVKNGVDMEEVRDWKWDL